MDIEKFCRDWDLSPHQGSFLLDFIAHFDIRGKDILELGGAMPKRLVIDHLKANSWTSVQSSEYANYRDDNQISTEFDTESYKTIYCQAENYLEELQPSFDAIFSIAAFEHFLKLPEVIRKIPTALNQNGILFSIFAPIWSGPFGHHPNCLLPFDKNLNRLPQRIKWPAQDIFNTPWDHLLLGPSNFLKRYADKFDRYIAEEITYETFHSPQINRLHLEDYWNYFQQSTLKVRTFEPLFSLNIEDNSHLSQLIKVLKDSYQSKGYSDFIHSGIRVRLEK
jgi:hypothetical protein